MHLFRIFTMYVNYILVLTLSIAIHKQVTSEEVCDNLHPCRFEGTLKCSKPLTTAIPRQNTFLKIER